MADLWSLSVAFNVLNTSLRLMYNNEKSAREAYAALAIVSFTTEEDRGLIAPSFNPQVEIADDFGTTATIDRHAIMTYWVTNLGAEAESNVEVEMLKARSQKKLQTRLASDPMLKGGLTQMVQPPMVMPRRQDS